MDSESAEQLATADTLLDRLSLSLVAGIGPRLYKALVDHFGSASAVLAAPLSELRIVPGIGAKLSQAVGRARDENAAAEEIEFCRQQAIALVGWGEAGYPRMLAEIPDPPTILFVRGELKPQDNLAIAIVGTCVTRLYAGGRRNTTPPVRTEWLLFAFCRRSNDISIPETMRRSVVLSNSGSSSLSPSLSPDSSLSANSISSSWFSRGCPLVAL
jgi:NAD-dependent DNA ligase